MKSHNTAIEKGNTLPFTAQGGEEPGGLLWQIWFLSRPRAIAGLWQAGDRTFPGMGLPSSGIPAGREQASPHRHRVCTASSTLHWKEVMQVS